MMTASEARTRSKEHLNGFPDAVVASYLQFAETGDPAKLDEVVTGVLEFYLVKPSPKPLAELPGSTRLAADLGYDSLAMIDVMFLTEGLFDLKLADGELARLVTLDDVRELFRRKLSALAVKV